MKHFYFLVSFLILAAVGVIAQGTETFTNMPVPSPASSYGTRDWAGDGGVMWNATDARTDLALNGRAITVRNGSLTAAAINNGIGNLSFKHQQEFSGNNPKFEVYINNNLVGTANPTTIEATASFPNINVVGTFKLEIRQVTTGLRIKIDDLTWTAFVSGPCTEPVAQPVNLQFTAITGGTATLSFAAPAPAPDKYLVTFGTNPSPGAAPFDGVPYTAGQALGTTTILGYGTALSYNLTALSEGTTYYAFIYAANDICNGGPDYRGLSPLFGSFTTLVVPNCVKPMDAPTNFGALPGSTSANLSFSAGAGSDGFLVVISTAALSGFTPMDNTTYAAGQAAGNGTIAYVGSNPAPVISSLIINTNYQVRVFGLTGFTCKNGPLYTNTFLNGDFTTLGTTGNIPAGYYDTTVGRTCASLKSALAWRLSTTLSRNPITPKTYTELWAQYRKSDIKPREVGTGSAFVIWDMYSDNPTGPDPYNFTPGPTGEGGQQDGGGAANSEGILYNREHSVPLSWFEGSTNNPGAATDYMHIVPTDKFVNALRGSFIFGEVTNPTTTTLNGGKLGPVAFSGLTGTAFEPIDAYKGDFARAFLYFVTRYESSMTGWAGGGNGTQAFDPSAYPSVDLPYLRLMIKWHGQDPVSQKERDRNDSGYVYQGNRNPYIDRPEFVSQVYSDACGIALPVNLVYFKGTQRGDIVQLEWQVSSDDNAQRFDVERSVNGTSFTAAGTVAASGRRVYRFDDNISNLGGRRVYYRLKAYYPNKPADYSDIFSLHLSNNVRFSIFPNPAVNTVTLDFGRSTFTGEVIFTNFTGQQVAVRKMSNVQGQTTLSLPVLPSGRYLVTLRDADGSVSPMVQTFNILR